jgi:hypothetical protein
MGANMDFINNKKITRRRFVKNVTGAAFCCACFPSLVLADTATPSVQNNEAKKNSLMTGTAKEHLAGACGIYCGACPAYIAKHSDEEQNKKRQQKRLSSGPAKAQKGIPPVNWMDGLLCDGCCSGGKLAPHCQMCNIRLHAAKTQKNSRCSDCEELPCNRLTFLINMGEYLHRKEYVPNLKKIHEMGVKEWVKKEEERWRCPKCGMPMSWYDTGCAGCGEPRSEKLFPLS